MFCFRLRSILDEAAILLLGCFFCRLMSLDNGMCHMLHSHVTGFGLGQDAGPSYSSVG